MHEPSAANLQRFIAKLEKGNLEEAAETVAELDLPEQAYLALCLSVGWQQKPDEQRAAEWRDKAREILARGSKSEQLAAQLLEDQDEAAIGEQAADLALEGQQKAIVLVALAQLAPAHRGPLLSLAEKLNYERSFPHNFLEDTIAKLR